MARPRLAAALPERGELDAELALLIGPVGPYEAPSGGVVLPDDPPDEVLELIWERDGERAHGRPRGPAGRAGGSGYWRFVLGEEMPRGDAEAVRLAELGDLRDEELAALHGRASGARTRIGTAREQWNSGHRPDCGCCRSIDQQHVDLWEMVEAVVRAPAT
jgi:hypothetical protein